MSGPEPLVTAQGLGISFPGVRAVAAVDFDVRAGEVHALVGENGAGKSTLGRLLSGELVPDEGRLVIGGAARSLRSPRDGLAAGVAMIPQELQLVVTLSVAENIMLGREPRLARAREDPARCSRCRRSPANRRRAARRR